MGEPATEAFALASAKQFGVIAVPKKPDEAFLKAG
jgi:hypothetical protein